MSIKEMQDILVEMGIVTDDDIQLITNVYGYTEQTMLAILRAKTGLKTFKQIETEID